MKLSFSTKGWHNSNFDDFCNIAEELHFQGIELHNIYNRLFTDKDGAFDDYAAAATLHKLYEKNLKIPCIDTITDVSDVNLQDKAIEEIENCIHIASNLHIPYIRLRANHCESVETAVETVFELIQKVLPKAKDSSITLLLRDLLAIPRFFATCWIVLPAIILPLFGRCLPLISAKEKLRKRLSKILVRTFATCSLTMQKKRMTE